MKKFKLVLPILTMAFLITGCNKRNDTLDSNATVENNPESVVSEIVEEPTSLPCEPELSVGENEKEEIIQPGTYEKVLSEENYRKETNWEEITKTFPELKIKYTVQTVDDIPFITELYCIGIDNEGLAVDLGSFTKENGFINSKNEEFVSGPYLRKGAEYFDNSLLGLSTKVIECPFVIIGMAMASDDEMIKTETMFGLTINCEQKTLEEWFPEL